MSIVKELIKLESDGSISFGDYTLSEKTKKSDFEANGDIYKVKTFNEVTRLEKNEMFVYESVPGTAVNNLFVSADEISFMVEGNDVASITLELAPDTEYKVSVSDSDAGIMKTKLGGKLSLSVELNADNPVKIQITKA